MLDQMAARGTGLRQHAAVAQMRHVLERLRASGHGLEHHRRRRVDHHGRPYRAAPLRGVQIGPDHGFAAIHACGFGRGELEIRGVDPPDPESQKHAHRERASHTA